MRIPYAKQPNKPILDPCTVAAHVRSAACMKDMLFDLKHKPVQRGMRSSIELRKSPKSLYNAIRQL